MTGTMAGIAALKVVFGGMVYNNMMEIFQTAVKGTLERIKQQDYESLDKEALLKDFQHQISFFDYKIEDSARWKFPQAFWSKCSRRTPFTRCTC